jgi:replicative superfamily II helicase
MTRGVGFHHAGLDPNDRGLIERSFHSGELLVLCCTSTLAVGVTHSITSNINKKGEPSCTFGHHQEYPSISG